MAAINIQYRGLTGLIGTLNLDTANTLNQVNNAAIADEGLNSVYYENMALERDPDINLITEGSNTIASLNITSNDIFYMVTDQVGNLQYRQVQRLDIAQLKRRGGPTANTSIPAYRVKNTYDINSLPTKYLGNTIVNNPHPDGLLLGRPWIEVSPNPDPSGIDDAVSGETLTKLEGQFQAEITSSFNPSTTENVQLTQWVDQSAFAHNLNSTGLQKARYRTIPTTKNGYGFVYFNGTSSCMTINPINDMESQNKITFFIAGRILDDNGSIIGSEPSTNTEMQLLTAGGNYRLNFGTASATSSSVRDDNWHVFSIIYDGSQATNADKLRFRIDSSNIALTFSGAVPSTTSSTNDTITLGCQFGGTNFTEMEIGALFIFLGQNLSSTEIQNVENLLINEWV